MAETPGLSPPPVSPFRHLVSCCSLVYGVLNLTFWCIPLTLITLTRLFFPGTRQRLLGPSNAIYRTAVKVNDFWFRVVLGYRWRYALSDLDPADTYLVIANHQSWADSFIIQSAIVRHGPVLKVLVKEELMRIPILALIFWAYDFPRLQRRARRTDDEPARRRQDAERIRDASAQLLDSPGAMLVYPEGTRFTPEKHEAGGASYRHLLGPRPGGFATMVDALRDGGDAIIDLSICYPETARFWRFLSGAVAEPELTADRIRFSEVDADPAVWLARRWQLKDAWLGNRLSARPGTIRTRRD